MTRLKNLFSRGARDETSEEELAFTREAPLNYDRDPFLHSLAELKPEDIPLSCPPGAQSRREKMKRILSDVAMYVCVAVFLVSCVLLVDNLLQKQKGSALYDEVAAEFSAAGAFELGEETAADDGTVRRLRAVRSDSAALSISTRAGQSASQAGVSYTESSGDNEQLEKLRAVLRSYKERNPDVYGYINIPDAGISYVMVQGEDNDFYLDHNFLGEYLIIGSIFVDYRCEETLMANFNTVVYGHNIMNGIMFHGVEKFLEPETFHSALIYIYTLDGIYVYKPFSVYATTPTSGYIRTAFMSRAEFAEFAQEMKDRSSIPNEVPVGEGDRMLTLSTCTNVGDGRYALHAVLVDAIT